MPHQGQMEVDPGVIIMGYKGDPVFDNQSITDDSKRPAWTKDGSIMVFRKLEQDVLDLKADLKVNCPYIDRKFLESAAAVRSIIPFGPEVSIPSVLSETAIVTHCSKLMDQTSTDQRGLFFVCYQSSLDRGFYLQSTSFGNNDYFPKTSLTPQKHGKQLSISDFFLSSNWHSLPIKTKTTLSEYLSRLLLLLADRTTLTRTAKWIWSSPRKAENISLFHQSQLWKVGRTMETFLPCEENSDRDSRIYHDSFVVLFLEICCFSRIWLAARCSTFKPRKMASKIYARQFLTPDIGQRKISEWDLLHSVITLRPIQNLRSSPNHMNLPRT